MIWRIRQAPFPATFRDVRRFGRAVSRHWWKPQYVGPFPHIQWPDYAGRWNDDENIIRILSLRVIHTITPLRAHARWRDPIQLEADLLRWLAVRSPVNNGVDFVGWKSFDGDDIVDSPDCPAWEGVYPPVQWFDGSTEGHGRTEAQAVQALKLWSIVAPWPNPDPDNILAPFPAIAFRSWPLLDGNTSLPGCTWQETLNFADWTACIGTNPAILHTQSEGQANQGLGL